MCMYHVAPPFLVGVAITSPKKKKKNVSIAWNKTAAHLFTSATEDGRGLCFHPCLSVYLVCTPKQLDGMSSNLVVVLKVRSECVRKLGWWCSTCIWTWKWANYHTILFVGFYFCFNINNSLYETHSLQAQLLKPNLKSIHGPYNVGRNYILQTFSQEM